MPQIESITSKLNPTCTELLRPDRPRAYSLFAIKRRIQKLVIDLIDTITASTLRKAPELGGGTIGHNMPQGILASGSLLSLLVGDRCLHDPQPLSGCS